jgi:hypothetical protein
MENNNDIDNDIHDLSHYIADNSTRGNSGLGGISCVPYNSLFSNEKIDMNDVLMTEERGRWMLAWMDGWRREEVLWLDALPARVNHGLVVARTKSTRALLTSLYVSES